MSLKDIGKFHKDVSLINSISDGLDFSDNNKYNKAFNSVRDSLEGLNVDDAAKKLRSLKINPDLAVDLLNAAKNADLLIGSTDEIADGIKKVSASSKKVGGLKDAFSGLFNIVKANPIKTAALAATAVGVGVYTYYKKQKEELIKNAHEVTSAWKESTDNLDSQMTQYKSLKEKLDSGTLSSSEEISVKQQILDIQNQIVSKYGKQASGINLVNGELGTQLALMQQISSENAKTTLNKSRKEYADAKNEMTKTRRYNLGNFNERDLTKSTYNSIKSLAKEFEKYGVYLGETGGSVYLSFEGDATQANEVVDNFMKRLSTIQSELDSGSSDYNIVDKILNDSSTSLSKNQKVLDNYQESYKTFLQMDMMSQGTGEGSIGKVFNDYTKSVEKYNNALSSGDTTKIKEARREFSSMSQTVQDALAMDGNKNFKLLFDDVEEQLNKSAAKAEDFKQILSGDSSKSNQFKDIAKDATTASEEIKKLKLDSADIKNALMTNGIQDGESSILKLSTAWGITADSSEEEIQSFIDVLVNAGIVSDGVAQGISQNSELISESFSQFKTSAIDAINSVDALNAALANSISGKGLSVGIDESGNLTGDLADVISMYGDLEGYDPSIVFERTANGIHLNREALRQLQAQQEALQKQDFINQQTELQKRLNEAIAEQQKYQKGTEEYDSAGAVVSDLQSQLQTVQLLASAYDGATSAYQKWLNAQSNGEEGDMYRNVSKTMKERGDELYKEGRYNTEEFRAIADFYSNEDLTNASMEKVVQAYEAAAQARERYFTGDKQGIDNFMYDLQNNAELVSQGVVKTLEDGTIEFSANYDKILAEQFNLSEEAIQSILRAAEEYNDKIKLGDLDSGNLNEKLAEATAKAEEAKEKLKELKEAGSESLNVDFNFDSTDINDLNNQINSAKENLNQFKNSDGVVDLSIDGADEAVTILSALIQQKQQVENPAIMSIDTSGLDEGVSDVISKLQEYQTAVNELNHLEELQAAGITVDTSELDAAKKKVDDTFAEIQGMSENGNLDINADVSVDASSKEKLNADLKSMTPEITAKIVPDKSSLNAESGNAVVNYKKGNQEKPDNRNAKVNYKLGSQEKPEKKTAKVDYKLGSQSPPKTPKTATVNYVLGTQANPKEKTVKVHYDTSGAPTSGKGGGKSADLNGTFHAYANGSNVSLNKNQSALVNELGMESVVRDGKWMMIPGGAHIEQFKKGDIIFNTEQTKDLIEHGYITGSNKKGRMAFADGTAHATLNAYSGGSWVFGDTGNGNLGGTSYSPTPRKSSSKSSSKSTSTSNAEKAAKDALDAISGYFDWVKVRFDRLARETELPQVSISANGAYGSTIQTYQTTIENKTYEGSSFTGNLLNNSGKITISTLILDSRGRSSTKTTTINSSSYSSPTISSFSVERCDSNGAFNTKGTYVKVICTGSITNVNGRNNNHYVVQYKPSSSSSWMSLISGYAYSININQVKTISGGFLATSSYDFRFTVTDSFSSNTIERKAQTSFTLINWSENGKGFSVGKVSEKDAFEVALPSEFTNTVNLTKEVNTNDTVNMLGETNIKTLNTTGEYSMSSGKLKDQIKKENVGANWIKARDNATIVNTVSSNSNFHAISSMKTPLGSWNIGTLGENLVFSYDTDSNYRADINETTTFMLNQWGVDSIDKQLSYTYNGAPITISLRKNDKMVFCAISWVGTAETNKVIQFTGLKLDRDWSPNNTVTVYTPSISASSIVPEKTGTTFKIHSDGTINVITNESRYVERIVSTSWII